MGFDGGGRGGTGGISAGGGPAGRASAGSMLLAWRQSAGERRGQPVTQIDAAGAIGRSVRFYWELENGASTRPLSRRQCEALADTLLLDRDERHALLLHNAGGFFGLPAAPPGPRVPEALRVLIDGQSSPNFLCDRYWNVLACNPVMASWWPWVTKPGPNLLTWLLLDPEARDQYLDWHEHADRSIRLLRFALAGQPDNAVLARLVENVCADPDVLRLWETTTEVAENRDGHIHRMRLPTLGGKTIEVVSHTLYPASLPGSRLVILTPRL
ncbi:helix-turn-helix transcriptional regulator [Streptomyces sp. NPDC058653]|uniref:helix-turn-helix transcriptional regulator n=1 Tax=Streptomyces sp. NPDC058653 TaxID=3346576 RepID=UPI00365718CA